LTQIALAYTIQKTLVTLELVDNVNKWLWHTLLDDARDLGLSLSCLELKWNSFSWKSGTAMNSAIDGATDERHANSNMCAGQRK